MVHIGKLYMEFSLRSMLISAQIGVPCKWTRDGKQFILDNFDSFQNSPTRIYNSAPVLCPPSSWLHKCYSTEFSQKIKVVVGPVGWGMCTRTVSCSVHSAALAYWNNTVAIGLGYNIIIIDVLTGSQTTVLSGHYDQVESLAFSLDGTLLVSGSRDRTTKLWDVQTGGVVKTFYGHTEWIDSVSISADNTMIASGSSDGICLWDTKTENCNVIKKYNPTVIFSPTNPQLLMSSTGYVVQQWNTDGHEIGSSFDGSCVAFSPDGAQFASCKSSTVTIRKTNSRIITVQFSLPDHARCCCFSPDGRIFAVASSNIIYLSDITSPTPHLIQTLIGHASKIYSLVFSSSLTLISTSYDETVKFWQIGASSADPVAFGSASIRAVSLQAKDGLAFSIDSEMVVKAWDILTGCCKESYRTEAKHIEFGDIQLIGDILIIVGCDRLDTIYVQDAKKGILQTICTWSIKDLRITGDGSKVLGLGVDVVERKHYIQAWDLQTGRSVGKVMSSDMNCSVYFDPVHMNGSKVLVHNGKSSTEGWDFGVPGPIPIHFYKRSYISQLNLTGVIGQLIIGPISIRDSATGREVFQLHGKYAEPSTIQWDGRYLIAGYRSAEVLILDFIHVLA